MSDTNIQVRDDLIDAVSLAMQKSWALGQTYWRQADSDSYQQQDKSIETKNTYLALVDEVRNKLADGFTTPQTSTDVSELIDAMNEVIRISDRDHDAWNKVKALIAKHTVK